MIPVEHVTTRNILKIEEKATVRAAARMMKDYRVGSLLVIKDDDYVGVFTETDLARKVVAEDLAPAATPVGLVMSSPVITIDAGEPILEAYNLMRVCGVRHLAVATDGKIIGVVSIRDLIHPIYGREAWVGARSR